MVNKENILVSVVGSSFVFSFYFTLGIMINSIFGGLDLLFKYGFNGFGVLLFTTVLSAIVFYPLIVITYSLIKFFTAFCYMKIIHINNMYVPLSFLFFQAGLSLLLVLAYVNVSSSFSHYVSNQELYILIGFSLYGSYRAVRLYYKILFNPEIKYLNNY